MKKGFNIGPIKLIYNFIKYHNLRSKKFISRESPEINYFLNIKVLLF